MSESEIAYLEEFQKIKADLKKWGKVVDKQLLDNVLKELVDDERIKIPPSFRLKEDRSYIGKALLRGKGYQNPIEDIEDKIGTRVVFLFSTNVKRAQELILSYDGWQAKVTKQYDEVLKRDPEKFGYQSIHIVVNPKKNKEYSTDVKLLTCEIQLRTLLQHAYSEISHDSTYKGPFKNDKGVIRSLSKSMALMEATDDYFCSIYDMLTDTSRKYQNYTLELEKLYKEINPDYDQFEIDKGITASFYTVMDFIEEEQGEVITIEAISKTLETHGGNISYNIENENYFIATQPVYLLAVHLLFNYSHTLEVEWPLSFNSFMEFKASFGL
jgi:putative GTP pyrophosphokinase